LALFCAFLLLFFVLKSYIIELKKMKSLSLRYYLKDLWNIIDFTSTTLLCISSVLFFIPMRYKDISIMMTVTMLLQIFSFLKIAKGFN